MGRLVRRNTIKKYDQAKCFAPPNLRPISLLKDSPAARPRQLQADVPSLAKWPFSGRRPINWAPTCSVRQTECANPLQA